MLPSLSLYHLLGKYSPPVEDTSFRSNGALSTPTFGIAAGGENGFTHTIESSQAVKASATPTFVVTEFSLSFESSLQAIKTVNAPRFIAVVKK